MEKQTQMTKVGIDVLDQLSKGTPRAGTDAA